MHPLSAFDQAVLNDLHGLHQPGLDAFMRQVTRLGNPLALEVLAVVACLAFLRLRQFRATSLMAAAALGGFLLGEATKVLVGRARPDVSWRLIERPDSASYPSGHALNSMSIYGTAALLTARRLRRRWVGGLLVGLAVTLALLIGLSRSYLGVHWPSDVVGGWCAGLACVLLAWWADRRLTPRAPGHPPQPPQAA
jgi:undecaprenyl-diphosphatase